MTGGDISSVDPSFHQDFPCPSLEVNDLYLGSLDGSREVREDHVPLIGEELGPPVVQLALAAIRYGERLGFPSAGREAPKPAFVVRSVDNGTVCAPRPSSPIRFGEVYRCPTTRGDLLELVAGREADPFP